MAETSDAVQSQQIDWDAIERSPEFQELVARRRRFVIPCTVFFLAWYMTFIVDVRLRARLHGRVGLRGPDGRLRLRADAVRRWSSRSACWYLRKSDREFDPLAERAIAAYAEDDGHPGADGRALRA